MAESLGSKVGPQQLGLAVQLPDHETFDTLVPGINSTSIAELTAFVSDGAGASEHAPLCVLAGGPGVGKSHLLHALCAAASDAVMYLALADLVDEVPPQVLEGAERYQLICIDDLDVVLGRDDWCYALFSLINQLSDASVNTVAGAQASRLVVTTSQPISQLAIKLNDLRSRLQWGLMVPLRELSDADKLKALQVRAEARGLELQQDVAQFMLQRLGRSMPVLMQHLAALDKASIAAQRRLTIPFVKRALGI